MCGNDQRVYKRLSKSLDILPDQTDDEGVDSEAKLLLARAGQGLRQHTAVVL